ncbi:MAG: anthranilate synthase component I [Candidatus Methylacidiphilales bacterium]
MITPSPEEFRERCKQGNLIAVYKEVIADLETPISAYLKLEAGGGGNHGYLLESAEKGERFGRYSFVGGNPHLIFKCRDSEVELTEMPDSFRGEVKRRVYRIETDPLEELKKIMSSYRPVETPGLPIFAGGAVGFLSFESVRFFEPRVGRAKTDDLEVPDAYFIISDSLLIFDHLTRRIKIVAHAHVHGDEDEAYRLAVKRISELEHLLSRPVQSEITRVLHPDEKTEEPETTANMTKQEYVAMTERMQEYIRAGDIFQVVPSQRFETAYDRAAIDLYRALRFINPSPYMFCLKFGDLAVVGSSPETHVRCENGLVEVHPIAGTRPRRESPEEDLAMEHDLLSDPKERAEHVMLVDLGRNDLGRVCLYDSVEVTDFMTIERYSHVMHIVSHVTGRLKPQHDCYDVLRATFPAGTVSGAPKVRAMQIITEGEPTCRGVYSGAVGYFAFSGNLDSCIAIRTVLLKNGTAYVQAGGGLVADSTPEGEYQESLNKAKAAMKAIALARCFHPPCEEGDQS